MALRKSVCVPLQPLGSWSRGKRRSQCFLGRPSGRVSASPSQCCWATPLQTPWEGRSRRRACSGCRDASGRPSQWLSWPLPCWARSHRLDLTSFSPMSLSTLVHLLHCMCIAQCCWAGVASPHAWQGLTDRSSIRKFPQSEHVPYACFTYTRQMLRRGCLVDLALQRSSRRAVAPTP